MQNYSSFNDTCCSVYSDEYMSSSGYTYYETRQQRRRARNESGRSMVEMLGVLAIVGVLSITGLVGLKTAMDKHRANELMYEASKRAIIAMAQLAQGKTADQVSLTEFTDNTINGATFETSVSVVPNSNKFAININGVDESICKNLVNVGGNNVQIAKQTDLATPINASQCENLNAIAFIFEGDDLVSSGGACISGNNRCNGRYIEMCNDGSWQQYIQCPNGQHCEDAGGRVECTDASPSGACLDGQHRCNSNYIESCDGGSWRQYMQCSSGQYCKEYAGGKAECKSDASPSGSCSYGDQRCSGNYIEMCNNSGYWAQYLPCTGGRYCDEYAGEAWCEDYNSPSGACLDGNRRCNGRYIEMCEDGSWTQYILCPNGQYCKEGDGSSNGSVWCEAYNSPSGACAYGDQRCNGSYIEMCSAGSWREYDYCSSGCYEESGGFYCR